MSCSCSLTWTFLQPIYACGSSVSWTLAGFFLLELMALIIDIHICKEKNLSLVHYSCKPFCNRENVVVNGVHVKKNVIAPDVLFYGTVKHNVINDTEVAASIALK